MMHAQEFHSALGCNVYVSEGRDKAVIAQLQAVAEATPGVALAHVFPDEPYHRTGFTLVSEQPDRLTAAVVRLSHAALQLLDLRRHSASHPRLGAVDHISLHPLGGLVPTASSQLGAGAGPGGQGPATAWVPPPPGSAALAVAATCAHHIARELTALAGSSSSSSGGAVESGGSSGSGRGREDVGAAGRGGASGEAGEAVAALPVYFYGHAHPSRRGLADVRRQLGYFRRAPDGRCLSEQALPSNDLSALPPDLGPSSVHAQWGVVTIGAVPWVVNYNVPLLGVDLTQARRLAKGISERGGGLTGVQAMALRHADQSVEVACNLLDSAATPTSLVQCRLEGMASAWGSEPGSVQLGYQTNKSPEELLRAAAVVLHTR